MLRLARMSFDSTRIFSSTRILIAAADRRADGQSEQKSYSACLQLIVSVIVIIPVVLRSGPGTGGRSRSVCRSRSMCWTAFGATLSWTTFRATLGWTAISLRLIIASRLIVSLRLILPRLVLILPRRGAATLFPLLRASRFLRRRKKRSARRDQKGSYQQGRKECSRNFH